MQSLRQRTPFAVLHLFGWLSVALLIGCTPVGGGDGPRTDVPTPTAPYAPGIDPEECRVAFAAGDGVGVGFPTPEVRLHSVGTVRATILFVDFQDAAAAYAPQEVFAMLSPGAEQFFEAISYGRMTLLLEPHLEWLRLSNDAAVYGASLSSFIEHRAFIEEAVTLADPEVDFSATDVVVVMAAPNAHAVPYGPTWMGVVGWEIEADGNAIANGITSGSDLLFWGSKWLNHELGHSMSLPDLYDYNGPSGFTRPFSLMDLISSAAPEYLAWERWQLGWLDDAQILCDPIGEELLLTPIETAGGPKAAMVKTSKHRVVVAESRRALGYDLALDPTGVVVSVVDAGIASGSGPIRVLNDQTSLGLGEQLVIDNLTIEVVSSSVEGDTLLITR
jgi:M6 family metalloprotease-like protein